MLSRLGLQYDILFAAFLAMTELLQQGIFPAGLLAERDPYSAGAGDAKTHRLPGCLRPAPRAFLPDPVILTRWLPARQARRVRKPPCIRVSGKLRCIRRGTEIASHGREEDRAMTVATRQAQRRTTR